MLLSLSANVVTQKAPSPPATPAYVREAPVGIPSAPNSGVWGVALNARTQTVPVALGTSIVFIPPPPRSTPYVQRAPFLPQTPSNGYWGVALNPRTLTIPVQSPITPVLRYKYPFFYAISSRPPPKKLAATDYSQLYFPVYVPVNYTITISETVGLLESIANTLSATVSIGESLRLLEAIATNFAHTYTEAVTDTGLAADSFSIRGGTLAQPVADTTAGLDSNLSTQS